MCFWPVGGPQLLQSENGSSLAKKCGFINATSKNALVRKNCFSRRCKKIIKFQCFWRLKSAKLWPKMNTFFKWHFRKAQKMPELRKNVFEWSKNSLNGYPFSCQGDYQSFFQDFVQWPNFVIDARDLSGWATIEISRFFSSSNVGIWVTDGTFDNCQGLNFYKLVHLEKRERKKNFFKTPFTFFSC